jgi:hypothetical protein
MATDSTVSTILKFGLLGGAAWWVWNTFFSSAASPISATGTASGGGTTGAAGTATNTGANASASQTGGTAAPTYSGPSLATIRGNLLAAVQSAYGSDSAIGCAGSGSSLSGFGAIETNGPRVGTGGVSIVTRRSATGYTAASPGGSLGVETNMPRGNAAACSTFQATYDVFNWYLTNRSQIPSSVPIVGPNPPDHTTVVTFDQYWAWVAPLLQQQVKGLSGFRGGLGHFQALAGVCRGRA